MLAVVLAACSGAPDSPLIQLAGDVTWQLAFDDAAHAAGFTDCSYTRHYEGIEDESAPWLCPQCGVQVPVSVDMSAADADCYNQIDPDPYSPTEILGWGNGTWYRAPDAGYLLGDQGAADVGETAVSTSNALDFTDLGGPGAGQFALQIDGTLDLASIPGDALHGYRPPDKYSCEGDKAATGPYVGDWSLAVGQALPDGVFLDRCGDPVRLYDLSGSWLVIDISAMDCGPCQDAAAGEADFVAAQAAAGTPTRVVTMLAPSLAAPNEQATTDDLDAWSQAFGEADSPILADRAWGLWLGAQAFGDQFGYPTLVVVSPGLEVVSMQVGFGSWDDVGAKIGR